jgi:hypothetical protein
MASLLAMLIVVPSAFAAEDEDMEETNGEMMEETNGAMEDDEMMEETNGEMMEEETAPTAGEGVEGEVPETGGPAILLPAAALLIGAGVLTFAVVRRRV